MTKLMISLQRPILKLGQNTQVNPTVVSTAVYTTYLQLYGLFDIKVAKQT